MLDVDIIHPGDNPAVENIVYTNRNKMPFGSYKFLVHCFSNNGSDEGFSAELEVDGQIYSFDYNRELREKEFVAVAEVIHSMEGFKVKNLLPASVSSVEEWGLATNQFHPVSLFMFSPNYWDGAGEVGHKHFLFMLPKCINPTQPNGFFNEFLTPELREHRKVFEALGSQMKVPFSKNQLSGLGFSTTKRNSLLCRVTGTLTRTLKINF
jgi:hypothetical protein